MLGRISCHLGPFLRYTPGRQRWSAAERESRPQVSLQPGRVLSGAPPPGSVQRGLRPCCFSGPARGAEMTGSWRPLAWQALPKRHSALFRCKPGSRSASRAEGLTCPLWGPAGCSNYRQGGHYPQGSRHPPEPPFRGVRGSSLQGSSKPRRRTWRSVKGPLWRALYQACGARGSFVGVLALCAGPFPAHVFSCARRVAPMRRVVRWRCGRPRRSSRSRLQSTVLRRIAVGSELLQL